MLYSIKLKSGESILAGMNYPEFEEVPYEVILIKPLSASIINGQLVTMPWPEFCKDKPATISIDPAYIVYSSEADEEVQEQYDRVTSMVHKN